MDFKNIVWPDVMFMTGIGTDVGKSYATGWLARELNRAGERTITQKFIQTGNEGVSEDIARHRQIMGIDFTEEDRKGVTAPIIMSYPASPHLAAMLDGVEIDFDGIADSTEILSGAYPHVIIEGAGGLMVPLKGDFLTADYIASKRYPAIVTVTGQLGSINHALLTFKVIQDYNINLFAAVYNPHFDSDDVICEDTRKYLRSWLGRHSPETLWIEMPDL